ncbi:hypothetical protein [Nocardia fluminea]|uniref:hypothetical protein n=1 Tax=Nocardia fluminea TaxID=134984 RepID=UPI00364DD961
MLAVIEQAVPGGPRAVVRALGPYIEWTDGRRAYTRDGYMTPSPQMREYGVNIDHLRRLGQWVPIENVVVNRHTGKISLR